MAAAGPGDGLHVAIYEFFDHEIHAKTIVIDPWGENPQVLIGSANFSKASCSDNDENAMLITGNKRLKHTLNRKW